MVQICSCVPFTLYQLPVFNASARSWRVAYLFYSADITELSFRRPSIFLFHSSPFHIILKYRFLPTESGESFFRNEFQLWSMPRVGGRKWTPIPYCLLRWNWWVWVVKLFELRNIMVYRTGKKGGFYLWIWNNSSPVDHHCNIGCNHHQLSHHRNGCCKQTVCLYSIEYTGHKTNNIMEI